MMAREGSHTVGTKRMVLDTGIGALGSRIVNMVTRGKNSNLGIREVRPIPPESQFSELIVSLYLPCDDSGKHFPAYYGKSLSRDNDTSISLNQLKWEFKPPKKCVLPMEFLHNFHTFS